jgi:hypothetical protein
MTDDFIRELQVRWKAQPTDAATVVEKLKRGRGTPRLLLWLEVAQGVVGVVFGAAFLWLAASDELLYGLIEVLRVPHSAAPAEAASQLHAMIRPIFALAGLILLVAQPLLTWRIVRARRESLVWEGETPESVLRAGARRAAASLKANGIGRAALWLLLALVASFWWFVVFGSLPVFIAVIQTAVYVGAIAAAWFWMDLRRERLRRELEACLELLKQYDAERGEGD